MSERSREECSEQEKDLRERSVKKFKPDDPITPSDTVMGEGVGNEDQVEVSKAQPPRPYLESLMKAVGGVSEWEVPEGEDEDLPKNRWYALFDGGVSTGTPCTNKEGADSVAKMVLDDKVTEEFSVSVSDQAAPRISVHDGGDISKDCSPFGPWMMVRRPPRFKGKGKSKEASHNYKDGENVSPNISSGSRFIALESADVGNEDSAKGDSTLRTTHEPCINTNQDGHPTNIIKGREVFSQVTKVRNAKGDKNPQPKPIKTPLQKDRGPVSKPSSRVLSPAKAQVGDEQPPPAVAKPDMATMREKERILLLKMKEFERRNPHILDQMVTRVHYDHLPVHNHFHGSRASVRTIGSSSEPPDKSLHSSSEAQDVSMELDGISSMGEMGNSATSDAIVALKNDLGLVNPEVRDQSPHGH
ncbi:hypothetical protein RIF29_27644 [Crotalaria pallida]|uniref:Uncharacterized protein n=1 Tax=Crotalaria pallida TaxID=3830 RepID=A0AAN9ERM1_CROPI